MHWKPAPNPDKYRGFLYEITNNVNGMKYIGRKLMWRKGKKGKIITYPWKKYTGSSTKLNKDIEESGIENFTFKILKQYKTKSGLRFGETEEIIKRKALTINRNMYYNGRTDTCYSPVEWYEGRKRVDRPKEKK